MEEYVVPHAADVLDGDPRTGRSGAVATEVKLPRLGQGMESGTIVKWLKAEGDAVEKGEPLYELDTDKVTQEVEAEAGGVLLKIAVAEGEVPVGTTIALIGEQGEDVPSRRRRRLRQADGRAAAEDGCRAPREEARPSARREREAAGRAAERRAEPPQAAARRDGGRIKASPLARRIARERGHRARALSGTGPDGRIVAEDVERAAARPPGRGAPRRCAAPARSSASR